MMSNFDPDKVEKLYSAITRLNDLGVDDVKGVPARHYTVTVDSKKMIEVMGLDEVAGVTEEQLLEGLPEEITSQFWLDARNRPVKTSSKVADSTTEMYFSDWGKKVAITAPARRPGAAVLQGLAVALDLVGGHPTPYPGVTEDRRSLTQPHRCASRRPRRAGGPRR